MSPNRTEQPDILIPDRVRVPYPSQTAFPNGMTWYDIAAGDQQVVRLSLVFRAGTRFQTKPFTASATVNMLAEGTQRWTAQEISERIDFYGAYYDVSVDRDYAVVSVACLSRFLPQMLELLDQVVVRPVFPQADLRIYTGKRQHVLRVEREKVSFRAREMFGEALFGAGHPYGSYFSETEYDKVTPADLKAFHEAHYRAGNGFAVTSGHVTEEDRRLIAAFLDRLPGGAQAAFDELPPVRTTAESGEEREGALQSAIRIGKVLFPRTHPDFIGMQVLATVLGGYFGSRLMSNLREERGYTYGVMATMVTMEQTGYLAVATEVGAEFTPQAVEQIYAEIDRLRTEPVGDEELAMVKNTITGEFMRILDGPFGIADVTIENVQNGLTNSSVNDYLQQVKAITPERLLDLANRYLTREGFATVVVGKLMTN
jgi:predicted Zn-dependent peptidase